MAAETLNQTDEVSVQVPVKVKQKTIGELLAGQKKQIEAALPKHLTSDRMLRIVMTEIRKNPDLKNCTSASLIGSVIQCSQLGLEPGSSLGHAFLVSYKNNKKNITECQFIIGYRGMIDLARRSGEVVSIAARSVYGNDKFEYCYGIDEKCIHLPSMGDRGEFIGAYVVVKFKDGGHQFDFMSKAEIEKIRDKTPGYKYWLSSGKKGNIPIWESHFEEMSKKTVIRRLFKYLPISIELQRAINLDEDAERGAQDNSHIIDGEFEVDSSTGEITCNSSKADEISKKL